jgi:hypothetical protein
MDFTSLLSMKYLWTDILYIVQDGLVHVASQINSIAEIYLKSYLTLCAANRVDVYAGEEKSGMVLSTTRNTTKRAVKLESL